MKKISIIFIVTICLTACSKPKDKSTQPSIYKKAIDDSEQIQININNQTEYNAEAIK